MWVVVAVATSLTDVVSQGNSASAFQLWVSTLDQKERRQLLLDLPALVVGNSDCHGASLSNILAHFRNVTQASNITIDIHRGRQPRYCNRCIITTIAQHTVTQPTVFNFIPATSHQALAVLALSSSLPRHGFLIVIAVAIVSVTVLFRLCSRFAPANIPRVVSANLSTLWFRRSDHTLEY